MHSQLEHSEHAEHAAHSGNKRAALLVAVLAAALAITEQGAKHAEIRLQAVSIGAADSWAQYQAKSIRSAMARDLADVVATMQQPTVTNASVVSGSLAPADLVKRLKDDVAHYEHGSDGKEAISQRAKTLEEEREHSMEQTHSYDNAAAAVELGIVLATASAITASAPLVIAAMVLGVVGVIFDLLAMFAPALGAI